MILAVLTHVDRIHGWLGTLPSRTRTHPRATPRPDHNPDALASYLFGMLSPLPILGLLFGVPAVLLGLKGLRYARLHPKAGGALQCRIGIALGGVFAATYLSLTAFLLGVLVV